MPRQALNEQLEQDGSGGGEPQRYARSWPKVGAGEIPSLTPHALRHISVSVLLQAGGDIYKLSKSRA